MALEWAVITNSVTGERIEVLFNPNEYSLNKDVNFAQAAVPGLSTPLLQFVHGNLRTRCGFLNPAADVLFCELGGVVANLPTFAECAHEPKKRNGHEMRFPKMAE